MKSLTENQKNAILHVQSLSSGPPLVKEFEITLNFHPDRFTLDGISILSSLLRDGSYVSQFVTKQSNGGLSAFPGGSRWNWESHIFGQAYDNAFEKERPIYGGLNYLQKSVGSAPRFGSAFFRLHPSVLQRTTFCYPDSYFNPEHFGTNKSFDLLNIVQKIKNEDELDDYIEAQIHGLILLSRDMIALVLDPCYQGTWVEEEVN